MFVRRKLVTSGALLAALSSCAAPMTGTAPPAAPAATSPAATVPAAVNTPAPASVKPAPAPALPAAPPIAEDARARLAGTVLFNDTPVADASLTAVDVATDKVIALTPWSDVPKGLKLLSTQRTDAKGAFDFELPKLSEGQVVKLVATKGSQTFTALFNSRGQAIGADTPTTASYQLQQGTAVTVTLRLRLTAATTAATQAFEGALKLTFQLPAGTSTERQSAVIEAARKAAQEVEAALAKPPLSAIPGLRGISPSLGKSEVAARVVASVNPEGAVSQVENFRTAVTNLGVFDSLFKAVQAELLALAAQKLDVRQDLAPIDGSEFPLDQVVISASGMLGFSGQRGPINLGGAVTAHFIPTPPRGGSGGSLPAPAPVVAAEDLAFVWRGIQYAMGLGLYGEHADIPPALRNNILVAEYVSGTLYRLSATANSNASFTLPLMPNDLTGVAPVSDSTTTIMVSSARTSNPSVARYAWDDAQATYTLEASGPTGLKAGGGVVAGGRYWQFSGTNTLGTDFIRSWPVTGALDDTASETLMIDAGGSRRPLDINTDVPGPSLYEAWTLAVDANGTATRVYWVTEDGHLIRYADEGGVATATVIATPSAFGGNGPLYGGVALAPGGSRLHVARGGQAYYIDNPAATGTAPTLVPFGTVPSGGVYGGAQARPGSVVFAIYNNSASSVFRIPTP